MTMPIPRNGNTETASGAGLAHVIRQSPTGSQMAIDGSFVVSLYADDPANALLSPPDGTVVMWNDSGTLRLRGYTRDTGWQTL
jgi:hypothetical protein